MDNDWVCVGGFSKQTQFNFSSKELATEFLVLLLKLQHFNNNICCEQQNTKIVVRIFSDNPDTLEDLCLTINKEYEKNNKKRNGIPG
jgi:hypothetical protein